MVRKLLDKSRWAAGAAVAAMLAVALLHKPLSTWVRGIPPSDRPSPTLDGEGKPISSCQTACLSDSGWDSTRQLLFE